MFYILHAIHLLLTVKEGGNFISPWGLGGGGINQIKPCVYMEEKGDIPYCTYRFNCNIIVLTVLPLNT